MLLIFGVLVLITIAQTYSDITCKSAYCSGCNESGDCTSCISGYILQSGDCVWGESVNCQSSYNGICSDCLEGYSLSSDNECKICIAQPYCERLSGDSCESECDSCSSKSTLLNGVCIPSTDNYCDYIYKGECTSCIKGYYLKDGKCTKGNIDKCYDYDSETKCSSCLEGLAVDENGGCTGKPVENCESYEEGLSTCYRCKEGYCWNEELKECISSSCVGCRVCANTEGTECSNCYYNSYYKDENNICQKNNIEGCDWYDGEGGCMYCEDGYRKNESNICEQCEVEYCMTCFDDVTICSKCSTGYYVDLDDCIKCPDNCADCSYNETTGITCNSCDSNYGLINNECNKCEDTSCRNCDGDTTLCRRCLDDSYILSNFKCDKCNEKCEYSKYDSSKCTYLPYKCIVDDNYCEKMYETGDCIECDNGFTLDNNKCYPYFAATGIDGIDYGCYYYDIDTNDFKDETPIYYFEPVDGHCVNPFVTETSSETTSTETTSSETTSSENSEGEENNNNNEDSCGAITIIIAICVGIGMI